MSRHSVRNTRRSYASALRYWRAWHRLRYARPLRLPVPSKTILSFLADHTAYEVTGKGCTSGSYGLPLHVETGLLNAKVKKNPGAISFATVLHRMSVLSSAHVRIGLPSVMDRPVIKRQLRRLRRIDLLRRVLPGRKRAVTFDVLNCMLATCKTDLRGIRDRAILLLTVGALGLRRAELVRLQFKDFTPLENGGYLLRIARPSENTFNVTTRAVLIDGPVGEALRVWFDATGKTTGPVFCRVVRGTTTEALSAQAIYRMVKQRAARAGLPASEFSATSLRAGFMAESARHGVPITHVMHVAGLRSVSVALQSYYRGGQVSDIQISNTVLKGTAR